MKFKVREDLKIREKYGGYSFTVNMAKNRGKIIGERTGLASGIFYEGYIYTKEMLEPVEEEKPSSIDILNKSIDYLDSQPDKTFLHKTICNELTGIYKRKNHDYGDSFANLRKEIPYAILVRIYDKYSRLKTLLRGEGQLVNDESIEDTLKDLANYCILELIERDIEKDGRKRNE